MPTHFVAVRLSSDALLAELLSLRRLDAAQVAQA